MIDETLRASLAADHLMKTEAILIEVINQKKEIIKEIEDQASNKRDILLFRVKKMS